MEGVEEGTVVGNVSILPETPALDDLVFVITGGEWDGAFCPEHGVRHDTYQA